MRGRIGGQFDFRVRSHLLLPVSPSQLVHRSPWQCSKGRNANAYGAGVQTHCVQKRLLITIQRIFTIVQQSESRPPTASACAATTSLVTVIRVPFSVGMLLLTSL